MNPDTGRIPLEVFSWIWGPVIAGQFVAFFRFGMQASSEITKLQSELRQQAKTGKKTKLPLLQKRAVRILLSHEAYRSLWCLGISFFISFLLGIVFVALQSTEPSDAACWYGYFITAIGWLTIVAILTTTAIFLCLYLYLLRLRSKVGKT